MHGLRDGLVQPLGCLAAQCAQLQGLFPVPFFCGIGSLLKRVKVACLFGGVQLFTQLVVQIGKLGGFNLEFASGVENGGHTLLGLSQAARIEIDAIKVAGQIGNGFGHRDASRFQGIVNALKLRIVE